MRYIKEVMTDPEYKKSIREIDKIFKKNRDVVWASQQHKRVVLYLCRKKMTEALKVVTSYKEEGSC